MCIRLVSFVCFSSSLAPLVCELIEERLDIALFACQAEL